MLFKFVELVLNRIKKNLHYGATVYQNLEIVPTEIENRLTLVMRDGTVHSWSIADWKGSNKIEPWIDFYKWFFGRTGNYYIVQYDVGETMVRREDIIRFTVHLYES